MKKIISKSFYFEAAHKLNITENKENKNIHGHSYFVEIFIMDYNDLISKKGLILDFSIFNERIKIVKKKLDHKFLNEIKGLDNISNILKKYKVETNFIQEKLHW